MGRHVLQEICRVWWIKYGCLEWLFKARRLCSWPTFPLSSACVLNWFLFPGREATWYLGCFPSLVFSAHHSLSNLFYFSPRFPVITPSSLHSMIIASNHSPVKSKWMLFKWKLCFYVSAELLWRWQYLRYRHWLTCLITDAGDHQTGKLMTEYLTCIIWSEAS